MGGIQWDASLSVGVDEIDAQHRTWIGHLNDMTRAIERREGPGRIAETLDFLVNYTATHFDAEERLMSERGYPGLASHRKQHEELRATLNRMVSDFEEDGANHLLAADIGTFLGNWLLKHIRETDRQFGAYAAGGARG